MHCFVFLPEYTASHPRRQSLGTAVPNRPTVPAPDDRRVCSIQWNDKVLEEQPIQMPICPLQIYKDDNEIEPKSLPVIPKIGQT
jgi:hypothetical protein